MEYKTGTFILQDRPNLISVGITVWVWWPQYV